MKGHWVFSFSHTFPQSASIEVSTSAKGRRFKWRFSCNARFSCNRWNDWIIIGDMSHYWERLLNSNGWEVMFPISTWTFLSNSSLVILLESYHSILYKLLIRDSEGWGFCFVQILPLYSSIDWLTLNVIVCVFEVLFGQFGWNRKNLLRRINNNAFLLFTNLKKKNKSYDNFN